MSTSALLLTGLGQGDLNVEDLASLPGVVDDAVPFSSILDHSTIDAASRYCSVVSRDREYSASIPIAELRDGGLLLVGRNGQLRLTVIDGTTLCWNVKDVGELRFTVDREPDNVPEKPTH